MTAEGASDLHHLPAQGPVDGASLSSLGGSGIVDDHANGAAGRLSHLSREKDSRRHRHEREEDSHLYRLRSLCEEVGVVWSVVAMWLVGELGWTSGVKVLDLFFEISIIFPIP